MDKNKLYKIIDNKKSGNFNEIFLEFNNNPLRNIISNEIIEDIKNKNVTWDDDSSPILMELLVSGGDEISDNSIKSILSKVSDENFLGYIIWKLEGSNKNSFLKNIIDIFNKTDSSSLKYQSIITIFFFEDEVSRNFIKSLSNSDYYIPEINKTISELIDSIVNNQVLS